MMRCIMRGWFCNTLLVPILYMIDPLYVRPLQHIISARNPNPIQHVNKMSFRHVSYTSQSGYMTVPYGPYMYPATQPHAFQAFANGPVGGGRRDGICCDFYAMSLPEMGPLANVRRDGMCCDFHVLSVPGIDPLANVRRTWGCVAVYMSALWADMYTELKCVDLCLKDILFPIYCWKILPIISSQCRLDPISPCFATVCPCRIMP